MQKTKWITVLVLWLAAGSLWAQAVPQVVDTKNDVDLPPKMRQPVKTHNPLNGGMSHGIVAQAVHARV
jgi:hypothetical protein